MLRCESEREFIGESFLHVAEETQNQPSIGYSQTLVPPRGPALWPFVSSVSAPIASLTKEFVWVPYGARRVAF